MRNCIVSVVAKDKAVIENALPFGELPPTDVRGKTLYTLISPGTELAYFYSGKNFPSYPGYASVFVAEEVGHDAKNVKKGDVLFSMGNHRSIQQCAAANTVKVPGGLSPEKAVVARLAGISMTTLMNTSARPGDIVLVTGAGPVGFLAAQIFALSGYDVTVADPDIERRKIVEDTGRFTVIERAVPDDSHLAGKVALVVECSGHEQAVLDACNIVRKKGEVFLIGVPWDRKTEIYAHDILHAVFHKYVVLRSGWEWELPLHGTDFRPHNMICSYASIMKWIQDGRINTEGLRILLDPRDPQTAYQDLLHKRAKGLFSIFDWSKIKGEK